MHFTIHTFYNYMLEYLSFVSVFLAFSLSHSVTYTHTLTLWNKLSSYGMCSIYRIVPSVGEIGKIPGKKKEWDMYCNEHQSRYYRQSANDQNKIYC